MSGNCAIGIVSIDSSPAIAVTTAMTMARRGRSTKIAENMRLSAQRLFDGHRFDRSTGAQALSAANHDQLAAGEALRNDNRRAYRLADLYTLDRRFIVLDD